MRANRRLLIFAIVIALVSVVIALVTRQSVTKFPDGSPQRVVQQYLQAIVDRDYQAAIDYLAPDTKCTTSDLDTTYVSTEVRVDLVKAEITGDTAQVRVSVGTGSDAPFGSIYLEEHVYRLAKVSNEWRITGVPWPLYQCGMVKY